MKYEYLIVGDKDTKDTLIKKLEDNHHIVSAVGTGGMVHYVLVDGSTLPQPEGVQFDNNSNTADIEA